MPRKLEKPEDVRRMTAGDVIDMAEIQGLSSVRNHPSSTMSARAPEAPEIRVPPMSRLIAEPPDLRDRLAAYKASQEAKREARQSERTKAATPTRQTVDKPGETSSAKAERTKRRMAEFRDFAREFNLTEDDIKYISFDKDDHPRWSKVHPDGKSEIKGFDEGGKPVTIVYRDSSNEVPVYTKSFDDDGYEVFTGYNEDGVPTLEQTFRKNDDGSLEVLFNGRDDLSPWDVVDPNTPQSWMDHWEGADLWDEGAPWNNVQQDSKGGRAVRAALEGGESAGEPSATPQAPEAPEAPAESYSGPRIAVNPEVFSDDRDALCVALNEAFRVIMEINGFDPVAEPTDAQRRFFADTAYANDETQLRRTILARICTFDTSIGKPAGGEHTGHRESTAPTQEQLEEAVEFLHTVLEIGAPQNKWEQNVVKRILTVLEKAVEVGRSNPAAEEAPAEEAPAEESPAEKKAPVSSPEEVQGDFYGGAVSKEEEDEFKRLDAEADRQIAEEKEVKQFLEERGMEYGPGTTTMEDAIAKHTEMVSGNAPADNPAVTGFGSTEDVAKQRSEMEKWAADRDTNLEKKAESELGAKVFAGTATDEEKAQWNNVAQQAAAQPFGGGGDAVVQQDSSRFVTNKAGMMVLNRDGSGAASRQAADFRGSTFDRATGNWSFADGTRMTSADKKAMNDIFNRGGRFDSTSIRKGMDDFDWS